MKIQAINNFFRITPQIKQQIKDGLAVYRNLGLPILGFIGTDFIKEKYKPQSDFYDKISL